MSECKIHGVTALPPACPICARGMRDDRDMWRDRWGIEASNASHLRSKLMLVAGLLRDANKFIGREPCSTAECISEYVPLTNQIDRALKDLSEYLSIMDGTSSRLR